MSKPQEISGVLCTCASERDNPYDRHRQPKEHVAWRDAYWAVRQEQHQNCDGPINGSVLKEDSGATAGQCQFALIWRPFLRPFRLRVNDVIRIEHRLGRVIRVTECAAVVLINSPVREFKTRFDKKVRIQPAPVLVRISANSETEVFNRRTHRKRKPQQNGKEKA